MKKFFIKKIVCLTLVFTSLPSILSLTSCYQDSLKVTSSSDVTKLKNNKTIKLLFTNYFEKNSAIDDKKLEKQKQKITNVIKKYRLKEWNEFYKKKEKSHQGKTLSSVLNLSFSDYSNDDPIIKNKIFNKDKTSVYNTTIYKNQDDQFRYFNDFINIFNEEDNPNQEDFLYLRWEYYFMNAAKKYWSININGQHLGEIGLEDWISAFAQVFATNPEPLTTLIFNFLEFYGLSIDINFSKDDNSKSFDLNNFLKNIQQSITNQSILNQSIIHAYLCSIDMVMRFASKDEDEIQKYSMWKHKAIRAKEINKLMFEYYSLLLKSVSGDFSQVDVKWNDDDQREQAKGFIKWIKELLWTEIEELFKLFVKVEFSQYIIKE